MACVLAAVASLRTLCVQALGLQSSEATPQDGVAECSRSESGAAAAALLHSAPPGFLPPFDHSAPLSVFALSCPIYLESNVKV